VNNTGTEKDKRHFEEREKKKRRVRSMFKNSVRIFVEKIYEMGFLDGSGVPVLYIGRLVPKG
jgi:hypothetical protein